MKRRSLTLPGNLRYVCARKGRKGFFVTDTIDRYTTVCDPRVTRSTSLFTAMAMVTGGPSYGAPVPVRLILEDQHNKRDGYCVNTREYNCVFKFAEEFEWTNMEEDPTVKGIVYDNKNRRYEVTVNRSGTVQLMSYLGTVSKETLYAELEDKRKQAAKNRAKMTAMVTTKVEIQTPVISFHGHTNSRHRSLYSVSSG